MSYQSKFDWTIQRKYPDFMQSSHTAIGMIACTYGPQATACGVQAQLTSVSYKLVAQLQLLGRTFCPDITILNGHVLVMTGNCPVTGCYHKHA